MDWINRYAAQLDRISGMTPSRVWAGFFLILLGVETVDYTTGPSLDVCFLLTFPVYLITWRLGWGLGWLSAVFCSASALGVSFLDEMTRFHPWVALVNFVTLFLYLGFFASVVDALRGEMRHRRLLARTDPLTELQNRRAFDEALGKELGRLARFGRPFTLLYFDLDWFKWVNDTQGHPAGDELLRKVARVVQGCVRETDAAGRMGGDEFAVLLPETGREGAEEAIAHLQSELNALFASTGYPVSASFGRLTCDSPQMSLENIWEEVDRRMYAEKLRRKASREAAVPPGGMWQR